MTSKANNIKDIAPILAEEFIEYELSVDKIREYQNFYDSKKESLGLLSKYLFNQMHDCEIISVKQTENLIDIKVRDINFFVNKENEYPDHDLFNCIFSFHLKIKNFETFSINQVLESGEIVEIKNYDLVGAEILYDQLIDFNEKGIELGLTLWKNSKKYDNYIFLKIGAEKIEIEEKQEEALKKLIK
jgi:hypothetical protein